MRHISIDIETFSGFDIKKVGAYKYVESPDFEILLLAYSLDGAAVRCIDLANGERIPHWLLDALSDGNYVKNAYNASFEWLCLSKYLKTVLPIEQWRCTMMHGLYCGYPAGLDAVGRALGLADDKKKLATGKALIRYFCSPCAPTKANGGRTRNLPKHAPERWELFKQYCIQDVVTESETEKALSNIPVPDSVQKEWETDLRINSRGVAVDIPLVYGALSIAKECKEKHLSEAIRLSGLSNPNSRAQLMAFLENALGRDLSDLKKATVDEMLNGELSSDTARRLLELRQEMSKTSTKKYDAIAAAVCEDGRVRGLLQFYGANRTGRWAGRLVQVQNLPKTYIEPLDFARDTVKAKNADVLRFVYGSVTDTLSQLIRTALVASEGNVLIDADFSAIEARVISWLAGEQWRLEVFRSHGKIYEASASQMFGVPISRITKGNPEYSLRAKGKVAELALGYQGGTGALVRMGALGMGLSEDDLPDIVSRWRDANKRIRDLWYVMENAATEVVKNGGSVAVGAVTLSREYYHDSNTDYMTILLPSGRKLYYINPSLRENRWGSASISYSGVEQDTKRWGKIETYGGKLVENVVQAIARDCLSESIERLEANGFRVIFHVHDEVVIECPRDKASLEAVTRLMSAPISWAKDLPLNAAGWVGQYFKKD